MKTVQARKVVSMLLVAMAISVSAATPAYASPSDTAMGVTCAAVYYFDYSYYEANCE